MKNFYKQLKLKQTVSVGFSVLSPSEETKDMKGNHKGCVCD